MPNPSEEIYPSPLKDVFFKFTNHLTFKYNEFIKYKIGESLDCIFQSSPYFFTDVVSPLHTNKFHANKFLLVSPTKLAYIPS